ncbi:putative polyphosphate/ATP-dependent NAD kinase [Kitasatospora sp. MAA19]|uniref:ATP-NAD kinase family protein n=1 Tax=Kitasatospora sp. MAA19 TaxID=3035090 RepID=UPI0024763F21|nr:NAD(+)/NADH kinase [Kitasatospora sp. MAA19]MDH6709310.1 putative polyphosphate/ATP-dependent NAD kinase [Kitasatospora sp. MAA19]
MTTGIRIGLVVNPVAGLGGRVGLKGSDGAEVQRRARTLGARPAATLRAEVTLRQLNVLARSLTLLTAAGPMGADAAQAAGLHATVVHRPAGPDTTAADTRAAVRALVAVGTDLLLFCGGDGTARDVLAALGPGPGPPVLGIPAGVKMHSAVFAVHPRAAAEVAAAWAGGEGVRLVSAEVMDRDEAALRDGRISARLHGWLTVPVLPSRVQQRKTGSSATDPEALGGIAAEVAERVGPGGLLALGPGGTTQAVAAALGAADACPGGVDVLRLEPGGTARIVVRDARADQLLALPAAPWIALSPIGGQGFLLGRGNQQITPELLRTAGPERLLVLATEAKLAALAGRPLLLDTGDPALDHALSGHVRVITGRRSSAVYRLTG